MLLDFGRFFAAIFLSRDIRVDLPSRLHNLLLPPPARRSSSSTPAPLIHCTVTGRCVYLTPISFPLPPSLPGRAARGRASERAGDLERGSIRNLKINALSARKSMGLIGMPIGPVKTIKREEKCLTTFPDSRHGGGERAGGRETDGGA